MSDRSIDTMLRLLMSDNEGLTRCESEALMELYDDAVRDCAEREAALRDLIRVAALWRMPSMVMDIVAMARVLLGMEEEE